MSISPDAAALHLVGLDAIRKRWGWILGLGAALVVLGVIALGSSILMTLATMVFIGWLMFIGGVLTMFHAFGCKGWGGFFIDLLAGVLYVVVGFMIVANPGATAVALTLLIAMFLIFGGLFRIVVAVTMGIQHWFWLLVNGVISMVLGLAIWHQWPLSGLWVIGLFIGIDMVFNGWALVMLGLAVKELPTQDTQP